jgi:glycosyltransferase involved in cell wall biosynthesis
LDSDLTGVGYAALYQFSALVEHLNKTNQRARFDFRLVAARPRKAYRSLGPLNEAFSRRAVVPYARRLKYYLWSYLEWPPVEWFSGPVDIAHNFFHQLPAARTAMRLVTIHDLSFFRVPETHTRKTVQLQRLLIAQCARRADLCIAVSHSCRNDLIELLGMDEDRIRVVHGGVNLAEAETQMDPSALEQLKKRQGITRPYFIHLGTIEPRKNLPRLLRAYKRLRDRKSDFPQLVLVGKPGWLCEPTFRTLEDLNLKGDVVCCGYLPREEAFALLRDALACVYPSLYEGFGLPVLEAMAARTPVIASNMASLPEVVGDTGVLVDPTSIDEIEAALESAQRQQGSEATQTRVRAAFERAHRFSWERSAQALADVYRSVVS